MDMQWQALKALYMQWKAMKALEMHWQELKVEGTTLDIQLAGIEGTEHELACI
jgi:hypothetical protein